MSKAGWGYIGVPNGFQHISDGYTANSNINVVDNRICHPDFADESIFAVIYDTAVTKSRDSKQLMTYFAEYRFAREIERTRKGSFYGSYVAFPRVIPNDLKSFKDIIRLLDFFSNNFNDEFISNYKFDTELSKDNSVVGDTEIELILSEMVDSIPSRSVEKINKRQAIVYSDDPAEVFFNSQELYEHYSVIYSVSDRAYLNQIVKDNNIVEKTIEDLRKETAQVLEEKARLLAEEKARREKYIAQKVSELENEAEPQRKLLENSENNFKSVQDLFSLMLGRRLERLDQKKERISKFEETNIDLTDVDEYSDLNQEVIEHISAQLGASIIFLRKISDTLESEYEHLNNHIRQTSPEFFESEEFIDISAYSNKNSRNELDNQGFNRPRPQPVQDDYDYEPSGFRKSTLVIIAVLLVAIIAGAFYLVFNAKELFSKDDDQTGQILNVDKSERVVEEHTFQDSSDTGNDLTSVTTQSETIVSETEGVCSLTPDESSIYTVQSSDVIDINNHDMIRSDEDIINQIVGSILQQEDKILNEQEIAQFKQSLINCNSSLNTENLYDPNERLTIQPDEQVRYSLTQ